MSTTPNMNLSLPSPSSTPGPTWASNVNTAFSAVDSHDHTPGKGTPVPASGLNITTDLSLNNAKLTQVGAVNLTVQDSALGASNAPSVYSVSGDLWFNNSSGTPVQITAGNSITSASSPLVPSGVIWPYGGTSAPTGFLLCDGTAVSRSTYATLFAAIGTAYGAGDGSTTFNLPDGRGRAAIGAGTYTDSVSGSVTRTLGSVLGAEAHVLTQAQLAAHTHAGIAHSHGVTDPGHRHIAPDNGIVSTGVIAGITGGIAQNVTGGDYTTTSTTGVTVNSATASVASTGSSSSHNNMQPSFVTNWIIKT